MVHVSHLAILVFGVLAWLMQFALKLAWLSRNGLEDSVWPWVLRLSFCLDLLVAGALVLLLVRALYWHPRSKAQVAAAVRKERQRIARELHDQVGSQLVNAMMLFDAQEDKTHPVVQTLEQCMLDLRLVVDSMDGADDPFADRLARLKHRIHPVMERRGIRMSWDLQIPEPCTQLLSAHGAAQLIAIVQEALSNVLQHSRATEVAVGVQFIADMGHWVMEISDNGGGVSRSPPSDAPPAGHGVEGMRRRARMAGGRCRWSPGKGVAPASVSWFRGRRPCPHRPKAPPPQAGLRSFGRDCPDSLQVFLRPGRRGDIRARKWRALCSSPCPPGPADPFGKSCEKVFSLHCHVHGSLFRGAVTSPWKGVNVIRP